MEYEEFEQQSSPQVEEYKSSKNVDKQSKPDNTTRLVHESPPIATREQFAEETESSYRQAA